MALKPMVWCQPRLRIAKLIMTGQLEVHISHPLHILFFSFIFPSLISVWASFLFFFYAIFSDTPFAHSISPGLKPVNTMAPPLTNKEFRCAFNAASYCLAVARHQGYALSLKTLKQQSYRNIPENKNARVYFSCVQGGVSTKEQAIKNPRSTDKNERSRQTSSIKIGCKFQVAIKFFSRRNRWSVDSENSHNHELIPIPEHLAKYRHLSNDAKKLVNSLTSASVPTRHIQNHCCFFLHQPTNPQRHQQCISRFQKTTYRWSLNDGYSAWRPQEWRLDGEDQDFSCRRTGEPLSL